MDIFEELKNKRPEDCSTSYKPEKITMEDVKAIGKTYINIPNRDDLYKLICNVHERLIKASKENKETYDSPVEYFEDKAFAYENAAYMIEEEMKKLYTKGE